MYNVYEVGYGETINDILNKFNVSKDLLDKLNGYINSVYPGMQIVVPNKSQNNLPYTVYIVKNGDSVYSIANKYNVNYKDILLLNGLDENDYIYPNQELLVLKDDYNMYITKENDTINKIAGELNVPSEKIVSQNASIYLMPEQIIIYKKEKTI